MTACARAVAIDAHVWEGRAPEHHPAQVQHLAFDLAIIPGRALPAFALTELTHPWIWKVRLNLRRLSCTNRLELDDAH